MKHSYSDFFRRCQKKAGTNHYHLTRLDVAIDDRNEIPYFTIEQIKRKCLQEEFVCKSRSYRFAESSFEDGTAKTVYIGDGKSNLSYRFYDKDKERCQKQGIPYEEMESWKRTELQMRDETAHEFAMLMSREPCELGKLTFDLLESSLRFVNREQRQQNKSRWKTSRFWERFLGAVEPLKLEVDMPLSSLYDTQKWLADGGGLSAIRAFLFLEEHHALGDLKEMEELMEQTRYSQPLSQKLVAHLYRIGRKN